MDLHNLTDKALNELRADLEHDIEQTDGGTYPLAVALDRIETELLRRFGVAVGALLEDGA